MEEKITKFEKLGIRKDSVETMIEIVAIFKETFNLGNEEINFTDLISLAYKESDMSVMKELVEKITNIGFGKEETCKGCGDSCNCVGSIFAGSPGIKVE